jgi:hypothetical protein
MATTVDTRRRIKFSQLNDGPRKPRKKAVLEDPLRKVRQTVDQGPIYPIGTMPPNGARGNRQGTKSAESGRGAYLITPEAPQMNEPEPTRQRRFLVTDGAPSHRLEVRLGLVRAGPSGLLRRWLFCILAIWIPLLVLSALQGNAIGHQVTMSFLGDVAVHARFVLAAPLLLSATVLGPWLADAASQFVDAGLVAAEDFERYDAAIDLGLKWRDSGVIELVLILLAYVLSAVNLISMAVHVSTWYAVKTQSGIVVTWAGWWLAIFCVPLMQFLTLRWLWRAFLWAQFLWRMNRLKLQLVPIHPDQAAGLAFVGEVQQYFGIVLFAFSIAVSGVLANGILYDGIPLSHFWPVIAIYVSTAVVLFLAPIFVFSATLWRTKRMGLLQYGRLGSEYTSKFQRKWISNWGQTKEDLLGTADIQSLADLGNSYSFVRKLNLAPMQLYTPVYLALACLIPMAPLTLTMMPLDQILKTVLKVFF